MDKVPLGVPRGRRRELHRDRRALVRRQAGGAIVGLAIAACGGDARNLSAPRPRLVSLTAWPALVVPTARSGLPSRLKSATPTAIAVSRSWGQLRTSRRNQESHKIRTTHSATATNQNRDLMVSMTIASAATVFPGQVSAAASGRPGMLPQDEQSCMELKTETGNPPDVKIMTLRQQLRRRCMR